PDDVAAVAADATAPATAVTAPDTQVSEDVRVEDVRPDTGNPITAVAPAALASTLEGSPSTPEVAVNAAGDAVAVWVQQRNTMPAYAIYASHLTPTGWSAPVIVAPWAASLPHALALAQNAVGDAVVAWSSGVVLASRFSPEEDGWSAPFEVAPAQTDGFTAGPAIALGDSGDAVVVWGASRYNSTEAVISARAQQSNGQWYPTFELARGEVELLSIGDGAAFAVATNAQGRAIAAWTKKIGEKREVWVRRAGQANGSLGPLAWLEPQLLAEQETWNGAIWAALDDAGMAFVAWAAAAVDARHGETRWNIEGIRGDVAKPLGSAAPILSGIPGNFGYETLAPVLAADASGKLLFAWREGLRPTDFAHPEPSRLLAKRFDPKTGWAEPEVVAADLAPPYFGCAMPGMSAFTAVLFGETSAVLWEERLADGAAVLMRTSERPATWSDSDVLGAGVTSWSRDLTAALAARGGFALWTEQGADPISGTWATTLWAAPLGIESD
ncbi:MAG: hypothetical protein HYZ29_24220, partial [Myxococcales bacterium]|nr:hypothetical protein [Myxococcales bacterium]